MTNPSSRCPAVGNSSRPLWTLPLAPAEAGRLTRFQPGEVLRPDALAFFLARRRDEDAARPRRA
jgi:hypothetical protein